MRHGAITNILAAPVVAVALSACSTQGAEAPTAASPNDFFACNRNIENAQQIIRLVCSLQSTDLAHREAGRTAPGNQDCMRLPSNCSAPDSALVIRLLVSPATFSGQVPRAQSIEISGFDAERAQVEVRELIGNEPYTYREDMTFDRTSMRRGATSSRELSPQVTQRILKLASELRRKPEPADWTICVVDRPGEDDDVVVLTADGEGIFEQLFFGDEEHAYQRNSAFYGKAGDIALLALENEIPADDRTDVEECRAI